ncbi:MAG: amino acid ABC transporter permease [Dehalococcoidia bacterium]
MIAMAPAAQQRRIIIRRSPRAWARENLFGSAGNTLLTVVSLAVVAFMAYGVLRFVFVTADWSVVEANRRLFFLGRFPADETWRVWIILYVVSAIGGVSVGAYARIPWQAAIGLALLMVPVLLFIQGGQVALLTLVALALFAAGYGVARLPAAAAYVAQQRGWLPVVWVAAVLFALWLLSAVPTLVWGGLMLSMTLTVVGIAAAFPLGLLLAIGRASTLPVVRWLSITYIEVIRGVPLITILFMATYLLPLVLRPERDLALGIIDLPITGYNPNLVVRAFIAITLFSAAYLAETIRGGLQAVPRGQMEAAQALGLGTTRTLAFIVLPQALRAVVPAIVGQFISLFKDTSLVAIVGLTDLLGVARQVTAQQEFIGRQAETLLFVAAIYWMVAFSMSRASQRLEKTLGIGER